MPTASNQQLDRLPSNKKVDADGDGIITREEQQSFGNRQIPTGTAKQNYTAVRYGNDKGSISFGEIHKRGDVTAGVMLRAPDGRHQFSLDNDGKRQGSSNSTSLSTFNVKCGIDTSIISNADDTLTLTADHGNICIVAKNGKIRLQANDIELNAIDGKGGQGMIRLDASESVNVDSKQFLVSSVFYKISSLGMGEITACGPLTIYGSIVAGVTASVTLKDSKVGGQWFQRLNNTLTSVSVFRQNSAKK